MEEKVPKDNKLKLLIGVAVVITALGYGISAYLNGPACERTDNAQIQLQKATNHFINNQ
ncbi:hypothetical protein [Pedobacter caeni]|uniref:Uncharacterized protein n=1 Tax=Pedobacter caeni TaxID=288992 RepID=A0A1M5ATS4_9SPHI|nr:hypothetical protein [Pedobacter caeni]SHF33633.1 hypothetical protein SAMN04488522_102885 [Pedobacter caeni]